MNVPDPDRHELLRALLESERGDGGPTAEDVSRLVHEERARRRSAANFTILAAVAIVALAVFGLRTPRATPIARVARDASAFPKSPEPALVHGSFVIERVDDAGLLEMLKDKPVALAALPNGERRLMMVVHAPSGR